MKIKLGPYPNRWMSNIHTRYMNKKYGYVDWPTEYTRFERFLEKFEDLMQTIYNYTINLFLDRRERKVKIHIDRWDTWSMDHTLAHIVLPMLKQLKATTHGAPWVAVADVPKELRPTKKQLMDYQKDGTTDPKFFERWNWVLDEMIYAFDCKANKDDVWMRFDIKTQREAMDAEQERISNGFRLFGRYYENLWD
jgi:hypothetical protein